MKICPQCRAPFQDEMNFCLNDGATLVRDDAPETLLSGSPPTLDYSGGRGPATAASSGTPLMHRNPRPDQRSSVGLLLGLVGGALLLFALAGGVVFWLLMTRVSRDDASAERAERNRPAAVDFNAAEPAGAKTPANLSTPAGSVVSENSPSANAVNPNRAPVPRVVSGGVVNGKATNLVKPPYPAAARAVRASGAVNVQVTIDEAGDVVAAEAVSGHPLLRASAVQAARASKFAPTLLSGRPVKVTGVIVYNFVP
jgi:TonB family protein